MSDFDLPRSLGYFFTEDRAEVECKKFIDKLGDDNEGTFTTRDDYTISPIVVKI